jgi:hypothetical protein
MFGRSDDRDELGGKVEKHGPRKGEPRPQPAEDELYLIDEEPKFVLAPLLATDPLPYLLNQPGEAVDADGRRITEHNRDSVPPAIRKLQQDAARTPTET